MGRRFICMNLFRKIRAKRERAATRIQKAWRRTRNKNDIVYVIRLFKNMHATRIQRFLRGYHVSQHLLLKIRKQKLSQHQSHFDQLRLKVQKEAVRLISTHVHGFLTRRAEEKNQRLDQKKGTKGKKSVPRKTANASR